MFRLADQAYAKVLVYHLGTSCLGVLIEAKSGKSQVDFTLQFFCHVATE